MNKYVPWRQQQSCDIAQNGKATTGLVPLCHDQQLSPYEVYQIMLRDERHQFTKIMKVIGQASSLPADLTGPAMSKNASSASTGVSSNTSFIQRSQQQPLAEKDMNRPSYEAPVDKSTVNKKQKAVEEPNLASVKLLTPYLEKLRSEIVENILFKVGMKLR